MTTSNQGEYPLHELAYASFLFPFDLRVSPRDIGHRLRLGLHHRGGDGVAVTSGM